MKASWNLSCIVDGSPVNTTGSFTVTTLTQSASEVIEMSNGDGNGCLTAPSSGTIAGAQLRMAACRGAVGQQWTVLNVTAV
jgi:hypothetical protein